MRGLFYSKEDKKWVVRIQHRGAAATYEKFRFKEDAKKRIREIENEMIKKASSKQFKAFWNSLDELFHVYEITRSGKRRVASFKSKQEVKNWFDENGLSLS